jgi:hypothetical protein
MLFRKRGNALYFDESQITDCYRAVNTAIGSVLSAGQPAAPDAVTGRSAILFHSPRRGRAAYDAFIATNGTADNIFTDAYFADVPCPCLFRELDDAELSHFIRVLGPDIMRANFLSANLVNAQHQRPLLAGGACALETWATRLLAKPCLKDAPVLRRHVLLKLLDDAPYYSHLTGAMMLGTTTHPQIMYDETFPWFMAIHDIGDSTACDMGPWHLDDARGITRELYDRIYSGILRRAHLASDETPEILRVPFEDLKLDEAGHLENWYRQYINELPQRFSGLIPRQYRHDGFVGAYVRYTYVGPDLLDLVKQYLRKRSEGIDQFTIHVRTKQDDHLYEGSRINRLLLNRVHGDDYDFLSKYANICNLAIYFWQQRHWRSNNGFVGFSDLSYRGNIVHDTIDLSTGSNNDPKTEERLWDILHCPLRLKRNNIEEHFRCLDKYSDDIYIYEEAAFELKNISFRLHKHQKKLDGVAARARERKLVQMIIRSLLACESRNSPHALVANEEIRNVFGDAGSEHVKKELSDIPHRYKRKARIAEIEHGEKRLNMLKSSISFEHDGRGLRIRLPPLTSESRSLLTLVADVVQDELDEYQAKEAIEQRLLNNVRIEYERAVALIAPVNSELVDFSRTKPHLFPLRDNLIFCHAMQLAFDPNVALFLLDAEKIESSKMRMKEKRQLLIQASRSILPRIKHLLHSIMSGERPTERLGSLAAYDPVLLSQP